MLVLIQVSTYFRGEVDILAVLCYNRYPRKATKYEQLNDKKRFRLIPSRNRFLNCMFDFTKNNAISNLLSSRNNLCKQKTRTRNNFPGAYFSSVVEVTGLAPAYRRKTIWLSPCKVYFWLSPRVESKPTEHGQRQINFGLRRFAERHCPSCTVWHSSSRRTT